MRTIFALALVLVVGGTCGCKRSELDSIRSNWTKLPLSPLVDSYDLQQAATSPCTWYVHAEGDRITIQRISMTSLQRPVESRLQFAGGTLVGENRGEWGGSLLVQEKSNGTPREILSKNVLQMYPMRDGVVVVTGRLDANDGSVWMYSEVAGHGWQISEKAGLHGYPKTIGKNGDRMLFAYGDSVSTMEDFRERQIATLPLLGTYPNSIAQDAKGNIYIGMNGFVVRLLSDRSGYTQQWFTQRECLR
jgi:hypothetical protein